MLNTKQFISMNTKTPFYNDINLSFLFTIVTITFFYIDPSFAEDATLDAEDEGLEGVMCNVINIVQGGVGKGIAAFGIIFIGVSLFLGKVSWGLAISTALGIGAIFGAATIVDAIAGSQGSICPD